MNFTSEGFVAIYLFVIIGIFLYCLSQPTHLLICSNHEIQHAVDAYDSETIMRHQQEDGCSDWRFSKIFSR